MNEILSPHFMLSEFTRSKKAEIYGFDNTPSKQQIENLRYLCQMVLEPLRGYMGNKDVVVTSGFRCGALNEMVGGSKTSHHRCHSGFAAADIIIPGRYPADVIDCLRCFHVPFEQAIEYPEFIHISSYRPRRQFLKTTIIEGETIYTRV